MARLFRDHPDASRETMRSPGALRSRSTSSNTSSDEPDAAGQTAQQHLEDLTWARPRKIFPDGRDGQLRPVLRKELDLIAELNYAHYFLTVHDIVRDARSQDILWSGQGIVRRTPPSAMCSRHLGRSDQGRPVVRALISKERLERPISTSNFEHSRREEVMQLCLSPLWPPSRRDIATVIHYRPRSAIRDVGKALGDRGRHRRARRYGGGSWVRASANAGPPGGIGPAEFDDRGSRWSLPPS